MTDAPTKNLMDHKFILAIVMVVGYVGAVTSIAGGFLGLYSVVTLIGN